MSTFISSPVSLQHVWKTDVSRGVLCLAGSFMPKAARLGDGSTSPCHTAPMPEASLFGGIKALPSTPSVLSLPRHGAAHFSENNEFEV